MLQTESQSLSPVAMQHSKFNQQWHACNIHFR